MKTEKLSEINAALRKNAYKLTPQRRALLKIIAESHDHMTPLDIYNRVRVKHPAIGLVTVYRTLEILLGLGLLCRVHTEEGCGSYLVRRPEGHHHHLVCHSCGAVVDFTGCDLDELERRLTRDTGFRVSGHLLEFNGYCAKCVKKEAG
jgi:Fur family transcriptional regulator, ferric uptake regulator